MGSDISSASAFLRGTEAEVIPRYGGLQGSTYSSATLMGAEACQETGVLGCVIRMGGQWGDQS